MPPAVERTAQPATEITPPWPDEGVQACHRRGAASWHSDEGKPGRASQSRRPVERCGGLGYAEGRSPATVGSEEDDRCDAWPSV